MKIKYVQGPPSIEVGIAGKFRLNEEREVDEKVGRQLLRKTSVKFVQVKEKKGGK